MLSLEYIAGFIDGEGCIRIDKSKQPTRSTHYKIQLIVVNTNLLVLQGLQERCSGKIYAHTYKGHRAYYWTLFGQNAQNTIKEILPFLVVKKQQATLALEFQSNKTTAIPAPGRKLSQSEIDLRESYYQRMRVLNARKPVTTTKGHLSEVMV